MKNSEEETVELEIYKKNNCIFPCLYDKIKQNLNLTEKLLKKTSR